MNLILFLIFQKNISEIISDLSNQNNLIDIKKTLDPIIKFIDGNQGKVYSEILIFYKNNKDNFIILNNEKEEAIKKILYDPECFLDNKMPNLKRLKNDVEEELLLERNKQIEIFVDKFNNIANKINSMPQFKKLVDDKKF